MSESKLYKNLKKEWLKYKNSYCSRVETKFEDGRPDLHLANQNSKDFFIELKYLNKKFLNKKIPIRKSQFIWFHQYTGSIESFFLIQVEKSFFVIDQKTFVNNLEKILKPISFSYFLKISKKFNNLKELVDYYQTK